MKPAIMLVFIMCAAACSQEVPSMPPSRSPVRTPADSAPTSPMSPATAAAEKLDQKGFSMTPVEPDCSQGRVATAIARWDARALKSTGVAIYVESPGNVQKLWMEGAATGQARTGKWVFEKSRFTLRDKASGEVLATRAIDTISCP